MNTGKVRAVFVGAMVIAMVIPGGTGLANPIPWPLPANMPLEEVGVQIDPAADGLVASVHGDFTFDYIPADVEKMMFPVPPDASDIHGFYAGSEFLWHWANDWYPTVLPETPWIPMIEWNGPFPKRGGVFTVTYRHRVIERPQEFVYFYAVGTGKYFPTYEKVTTANFDIALPPEFIVNGIWLDNTPVDSCNWGITNGHLLLTLTSEFGPFTKDLIVSLVPEPSSLLALGTGLFGLGGFLCRRSIKKLPLFPVFRDFVEARGRGME